MDFIKGLKTIFLAVFSQKTINLHSNIFDEGTRK